MWKRQYISKGGRITLIRSTLSNLPIYFMSIFQLPRAIRMRLEKIQRDFLWGGGALEQKPHLARWPIVCKDKSIGGWGLRALVIRRKYREEKGGWTSCEIREAYGVGLWKAINKVGQLVTPFFGYEVGKGKNVKFWKDKWCGTSPLSEAFPSLFALATSKEAWVNKIWTAEGERRGSWTPTFNRSFNDWEMEEVGRFLCCLEEKMIRVDEEDKPKISFFAWEASWGRVLTLDRLQRGVGLWQIGVLFANSVGSRLTTSSFIVKEQVRLERLLCGQEEKGGVAFGTVMLVLGYLEG
ncbi:putative ribonuclease H protein [Vitis vinifera]|uniref:Putative ribonuclease H protein n=1 Tax=Vitis vinifera TaxID=29760 RepID=A0A438J694_VITVI|nr:putative ribonuclease H protein [Vitis vinifera]